MTILKALRGGDADSGISRPGCSSRAKWAAVGQKWHQSGGRALRLTWARQESCWPAGAPRFHWSVARLASRSCLSLLFARLKDEQAAKKNPPP
jgi:hypothetical protein